MKKIAICISLIIFVLAGCKNDDTNSVDDITAPEGYTLTWNDEFEGTEINTSNWVYELGDGTAYGLAPGWGNGEKQLYTNSTSNSKITIDSDGNSALVIIANEESAGSFTSAKLTTQNLQSFRFGKIEARMKLPEGKGLWPALWMLGDNITEIDWPGCGEVDLFELLGDAPNTLYNNVHYTNAENKHNEMLGTYVLGTGNFSDNYHIFRLDWTPESMVFSVDGEQTHMISIGTDMKEFQRSFYLILNIAVGGGWPGDPDNTTVFPQEMYIDYIRVFEKDDFTAPTSPPLIMEEEALGTFLDAGKAINSNFTGFGDLVINSFGGGGEPDLTISTTSVDGSESVALSFPGGNWGGAFFEMIPTDLSSFASGNLVFSINKPAALVNAEIKLESPATNAAVLIKDYTPVEIENGFLEYTIPLVDFAGLDLTQIKIPFAFWNPTDANGDFPVADVLVDNILFE